MVRRRLPIGIQTFRKLRERDCYYVDKTAYIERLLHEGTHYFLSRPRRFGKSLFLDTLKELFEGSEELFAGLHVHDRHNWTERHPVVRLDFGRGHFGEPGLLEAGVMEQLAAAERRTHVRKCFHRSHYTARSTTATNHELRLFPSALAAAVAAR